MIAGLICDATRNRTSRARDGNSSALVGGDGRGVSRSRWSSSVDHRRGMRSEKPLAADCYVGGVFLRQICGAHATTTLFRTCEKLRKMQISTTLITGFYAKTRTCSGGAVHSPYRCLLSPILARSSTISPPVASHLQRFSPRPPICLTHPSNPGSQISSSHIPHSGTFALLLLRLPSHSSPILLCEKYPLPSSYCFRVIESFPFLPSTCLLAHPVPHTLPPFPVVLAASIPIRGIRRGYCGGKGVVVWVV